MASTSPGTNISVNTDEDNSKSPRIVFLLMFILISFVGNLFVVVVVFQNKKFRTIQNLLICNLCIICIVDCWCNMLLVLGALLRNEWIYGYFMCKVNNFFMNFVSFNTVLTVASLTCDRFFAVRFNSRYESWFSPYRFYLFVSYLWLHALSFSIPFLTSAVQSTFRPQLHLCTVDRETSLPFLYSTLIGCFLLPLTIAIVFQILLLRLTWIQNHARKKEVAEKQYTQMLTDSPQIRVEAPPPSYILYILVLFISWLILHAPFAVSTSVKHYHHSQGSEENSWTEYPWEVDATFIWMRFFFSCIVPCLTFYFRKDIWQSTKECVLCRKHNSVVDMEVVSKDSDIMVKKMTVLKNDNVPTTPKQKEKEKTDVPVAFTVPVLFATSNGIHIGNAVEVEFNSQTFSSSCSLEFQRLDTFQGKSLDVNSGDQQIPNELLGDTSDYDSSCEIDPYSVSQPVSTRNVVGTLHKTLSMSNPEIPVSIHKELAGTIGADSGLDLSGTAGSSVGNSIKAKISLNENQKRISKDSYLKSHTNLPHSPPSNNDKYILTETPLNTVAELDHEDRSQMQKNELNGEDNVESSQNLKSRLPQRQDKLSGPEDRNSSLTKESKQRNNQSRGLVTSEEILDSTKGQPPAAIDLETTSSGSTHHRPPPPAIDEQTTALENAHLQTLS